MTHQAPCPPNPPVRKGTEDMQTPNEEVRIQVIHKDDTTFQIGTRPITMKSNLEVKRGRIVVLMGASGVGKTSVIEAVMPARRGDAMVYQGTGGLPHLSVQDNLRLLTPNRQRIIDTAERLGLPLQQTADSLSGGEKRRLAVARGLLAKAPVCWLDEPEAGLDLASLKELALMLQEVVSEPDGPAVVLVTHSATLASLVRPWRVWILERKDGEASFSLVNPAPREEPPPQSRSGAPVAPPAESDSDSQEASSAQSPSETLEASPAALGSEDPAVRDAIWKKFEKVNGATGDAPRSQEWRGTSPSAKSTWLTLRLTVFSAHLWYYLAVGAALGTGLVMTLSLLRRSLGGQGGVETLLTAVGPHFIVEAVPALACILIASSTGSMISSWVATMAAQRDLSALGILGVAVTRRVLFPIAVGLFISAMVGMFSIVAATLTSFAVYLALDGGYAVADAAWGLLSRLYSFGGKRLIGALLETMTYAALLVFWTVTVASRPTVSTQADVARAIRRVLMRTTLGVMLIKLVLMFADLQLHFYQ